MVWTKQFKPDQMSELNINTNWPNIKIFKKGSLLTLLEGLCDNSNYMLNNLLLKKATWWQKAGMLSG